MNYLITNGHVLSGRFPDTNKPIHSSGLTPDSIFIWHHVNTKLGTWMKKQETLVNPDGTKKWLQHSAGREIDVVALPISTEKNIKIYPIDLTLSTTDLLLEPSEQVSIIGFPFGLSSAGRFPIWKTGHIASDIDLDYNGKPVFIIDATTKPGMSGSPVIARRIGMVRTSTGINMGGQATRFLGIYSGRIHGEADIGIVWKPKVLDSIIP